MKVIESFDLNGKGFLDSRQGLAKNLDDLRDWDFNKNIVPNGFEVCVAGTWYTYKPDEPWSETTGLWKIRETGTGSDLYGVKAGKIVGEIEEENS